VVELLLEKGAELESKDNLERTALTWAAVGGEKDVVKLLLAKNNIDPNQRDKFRLTPLLFAVKNGYLDVVKLLLEKCREKMPRERVSAALPCLTMLVCKQPSGEDVVL
jgi:ankyrin repeat protein